MWPSSLILFAQHIWVAVGWYKHRMRILETPFVSDFTHTKPKQNKTQTRTGYGLPLYCQLVHQQQTPSPSRKSWSWQQFLEPFSHCLSGSSLMMPSLPRAVEAECSSSLFDPHHICPLLLKLCLLEDQVWPCEIVLKSLPTCLEKSGNITCSTQMLGDYLSSSVWFNWLSWRCRPCQEKSSSQPKGRDYSPRKPWSAPAACVLEPGWCLWRLPLDSDQRQGCWEWRLPKEGGGRGSFCEGCVCVYPCDAFTEVTQEGGGQAEFLNLLHLYSQTSLTVAQFCQAKDFVAHQAHSFLLSSWKEFSNNKRWKGKRKTIKTVMQQILKTKQSEKKLKK